jgi:hypothetical protein
MKTADTITVHVPFRIVKRGGRKEMLLPALSERPKSLDRTLIKAIARAFRWQRMLESGEFATIGELAKRDGISPSYLTRILRLTLLPPILVEAILDGRTGLDVTLDSVLNKSAVAWENTP